MKGLFQRRPPPVRLPAGQRIYAIGDVHGRLDLLDRLLASIRADSARRGDAEVTVVQVGDMIDRGPDSIGVIRRLMEEPDWARLEVLRGNHEAALLDALDGDTSMLSVWLRNGGWSMVESLGLDAAALDERPSADIVDALHAALRREDIAWLHDRPLSFAAGDYLFVHAGIRPARPLDRQTPRDLMWIRDEFLLSRRWHGAMIVHGHTPADEIEHLSNRINLDTGAYRSDRLSAVGLEGEERWFLQT